MWERIRQFLGGGDRQTAVRPPSGPRIGPRDIYSQDLPLNEDEFLSRNQSLRDVMGDLSSSPMGMVMSHMIPGGPSKVVGRVPKPVRNKITNPGMSAAQHIMAITKSPLGQRIQKWLQWERDREWMKPGAMEESQRRIGNLIMNERMDATGKMTPVPDPQLDAFKQLEQANKQIRERQMEQRRKGYRRGR